MELYLILAMAFANMFGVIGTWITDSRGKNLALGYAAGFIFGPIGLLALARLYPKKRF
jgi:hypothetical protein